MNADFPTICSRAPVRVSFVGGGTDVSPYCEEKGGCVVTVSVNRYAWATLRSRPDAQVHIAADDGQQLTYAHAEDMAYDGHLDAIKAVIKAMKPPEMGLDLFLRADVPLRSGLGSSASTFVALVGLFNHLRHDRRITDYEVAELAWELERHELGNFGGRQDQYAAVFGGLNFIEFRGNDFVRVNRLRLPDNVLYELEKRLVLAFVGSRQAFSGGIIEDQTRRYQAGEVDTVQGLDDTKRLAQEVKSALIRGDLLAFGHLLEEAWEAKKRLSPLISNPHLERLYQVAREHGALGGKVSGAGGGGHMFFYCAPDTERAVAAALEREGAQIIPFSFDTQGLRTWESP